MRNINCIVIDKNEHDLEILSQHINSIPFFNLIGTFRSSENADGILKTQKVDLLFLDIENCGMAGLHYLKSLSYSTRVVITTNKDNFALEAFNLDVLDYLLKPISIERFWKAADKAHELFSLLSFRDRRNNFSEAYFTNSEYLFVTSDYSLVKIKLSDVSYIEGLKDYLKIYFVNQPNPVITRMTMKGLEEKLPKNLFFRVHKSYIVSIDKIDIIRSQRIKIGQNTVPISDGYYETFRQKVNI
ncbi:LytTR family DNA-binding domain-containing protein [Dyadobacter sp. CY345]|uniref:LytR/AlgR family response regulator transcription factor n=1 Tax=Dyadobacter sp. CY345 TaxID=2909335 RepID=UPI001F1F55AF|nr:LytTR family DNA-binding domain-containing protein [Dyadobacter sp. CY345]MCF2447138.1 LytTR family DNA-binding domain-containing protein [Dyadobacter sp. CY345]